MFPSLWFVSWLFATLPTCALYQSVCASIHPPAFCPIIWFTNYSNLVPLMQLCTPRYAFDGNTFGTDSWDPSTLQSFHRRKTKTFSEYGWQRFVFLISARRRKDFDIFIKQRPVCNGTYAANMQRVAKGCATEMEMKSSPVVRIKTVGLFPEQMAAFTFSANMKIFLKMVVKKEEPS